MKINHPLIITTLYMLSLSSNATQLVYTPTNPSFGGNPINGNYLLGNATSQNKFKSRRNKKHDKTALEDFNDRLQRSILNRLTNSITGNFINDEGKLIPGVTETNDFMIEIINIDNNMLSITTTEKLTGNSTTFVIESN